MTGSVRTAASGPATLATLVLAVLAGLCHPSAAEAADTAHHTPRLVALCYHDVVETEAGTLGNPDAVTVDALVRQFAWLDAQGYEPISLSTWAAAADGGPLPDKPVLLTFDDGYAGFSEHVLPLLELFGFPAVLAPVTSWIDAPAGTRVRYGDETVPRAAFMSWADVRAAAATGLVEIASHSHDLHHGVSGNPFGNTQPAAVTRRHLAGGGYETEEAYRRRVHDDLAESVALIEAHTGVRPATIAWPYGAYNAAASAAARSLGLTRALTLDRLPNSPGDPRVHRRLMGADVTLEEFVMTVRGLYPPPAIRAAHVDLDYVYDPDPVQQSCNLDRLLDRIKAMAINRVFLQAFADPDGDGVADAVYFPNRHLPVRADLFNRVAWQLRTRSGVQVFAWMPVLAFRLPDPDTNRRLAVRASDGSHDDRYHRLSPYDPEARRIISDVYDDLGRSSRFAGVLFHDDAFLTDAEDVSPAALAHLGAEQPGTARPAGDAPPQARAKTRYLIEFTEHLSDVLRRHEPALVTARNLYARPVMEPHSEAWFAQNLRLFLDHYDYAAVMAMPYLEGARAPGRWLEKLVHRVAGERDGLARTIFELQTRNWRTGEAVEDPVLAKQIDTLLDAGVLHVAWYPDDFIGGRPGLAMLRSKVSLATHPARLP